MAEDAATYPGPIDECVYCTRLIGSDPSLVLHGGGNSSVKATYDDITGETVPAIYVKGSGWDMATIEAPGLTALRLSRVRQIASLDSMSDPDMMRELDAARFDPAAPSPSVETLLHALLPYPAVQHSHADVIVTLTNVADGHALVGEVFGDRVIVVPYVMPGFDLARAVREAWPGEVPEQVIGVVLLNHGLFTFGATSAEAYERHVELITAAERWLDTNAPRPSGHTDVGPAALVEDLAALRARICRRGGPSDGDATARRRAGDALRAARGRRPARFARAVDTRPRHPDQTRSARGP